VFDFVVAGVGLVFAAFGGWGVAIAAEEGAEMVQLANECGSAACFRTAYVTSHSRVYIPPVTSYGAYGVGSRVDICFVSLAFSGIAKDAAIAGPSCARLADGGEVVTRVWRGDVMDVEVAGVDYISYLNPETGFLVGLFRMLGLLPALVCFAVVHYDLANHHMVRRLRHSVHQRLFGRLPAST
jgi:hypothetical protein